MRLSRRVLLPLSLVLNLLLLAVMLVPLRFTEAQTDVRYFPETKHTVQGAFLTYWTEHGGLAQQGYPLTEEFQEVNKLDGKTYTVQYFERSIFEKHPENKPPYDVLLSQLGKFEIDARYPNNSNPAAAPVAAPGGGPAPQPTQPAPPPPAPSIVGQILDFPGIFGKGPLHGTVTKVEETQTIPGGEFTQAANAKGKFVVVFMTVSNPGNAPSQAGSASFQLKDNRARVFNMADLNAQFAARDHYQAEIIYKEIQPGLSEPSVFVFDVAPDATSYVLVPGK